MKVKKSAEVPDRTENNSGDGPETVTDQTPNPEVKDHARRRQYSATYKLRILEELDRCSEPGEVGSLLGR